MASPFESCIGERLTFVVHNYLDRIDPKISFVAQTKTGMIVDLEFDTVNNGHCVYISIHASLEKCYTTKYNNIWGIYTVGGTYSAIPVLNMNHGGSRTIQLKFKRGLPTSPASEVVGLSIPGAIFYASVNSADELELSLPHDNSFGGSMNARRTDKPRSGATRAATVAKAQTRLSEAMKDAIKCAADSCPKEFAAVMSATQKITAPIQKRVAQIKEDLIADKIDGAKAVALVQKEQKKVFKAMQKLSQSSENIDMLRCNLLHCTVVWSNVYDELRTMIDLMCKEDQKPTVCRVVDSPEIRQAFKAIGKFWKKKEFTDDDIREYMRLSTLLTDSMQRAFEEAIRTVVANTPHTQ